MHFEGPWIIPGKKRKSLPLLLPPLRKHVLHFCLALSASKLIPLLTRVDTKHKVHTTPQPICAAALVSEQYLCTDVVCFLCLCISGTCASFEEYRSHPAVTLCLLPYSYTLHPTTITPTPWDKNILIPATYNHFLESVLSGCQTELWEHCPFCGGTGCNMWLVHVHSHKSQKEREERKKTSPFTKPSHACIRGKGRRLFHSCEHLQLCMARKCCYMSIIWLCIYEALKRERRVMDFHKEQLMVLMFKRGF